MSVYHCIIVKSCMNTSDLFWMNKNTVTWPESIVIQAYKYTHSPISNVFISAVVVINVVPSATTFRKDMLCDSINIFLGEFVLLFQEIGLALYGNLFHSCHSDWPPSRVSLDIWIFSEHWLVLSNPHIHIPLPFEWKHKWGELNLFSAPFSPTRSPFALFWILKTAKSENMYSLSKKASRNV